MKKTSDTWAKQALVNELIRKGYHNVRIVGTPCDVIGEKNGVVYYFEVKSTMFPEGKHTGSVSGTELDFALKNKKTYFFVIVFESNGMVKFDYLKVDQMMKLLTLQPSKYHFAYGISKSNSKKKISIPLTEILHAEAHQIYKREKAKRMMVETNPMADKFFK
jgi:Holliday junction resolvase